MKFKFIEHTADVQYEAYGKTIEECFKNSAEAMIKSISDKKIKSKIKKEININGTDFENLLYNFLEELLILFDSDCFILSKIDFIKIDLEKKKLKASLLGDSSENYNFFSHIKAITYSDMRVEKINNKWICRVTLDL